MSVQLFFLTEKTSRQETVIQKKNTTNGCKFTVEKDIHTVIMKTNAGCKSPPEDNRS